MFKLSARFKGVTELNRIINDAFRILCLNNGAKLLTVLCKFGMIVCAVIVKHMIAKLQTKSRLVKALLNSDITITARKYVGHEDDTGYNHYAIDVAKEYGLEEI